MVFQKEESEYLVIFLACETSHIHQERAHVFIIIMLLAHVVICIHVV